MDRDRVTVIECNLDDMTGEALGYAMEQCLAAGALDVWFTPITMKKSRPAVMLSVLCREDDAETLQRAVLTQTTTLGVRYRTYDRVMAARTFVTVETPWGPIRCKCKWLDGQVVSIKAEYDDCAAAALAAGVPLARVTAWAERKGWREIA